MGGGRKTSILDCHMMSHLMGRPGVRAVHCSCDRVGVKVAIRLDQEEKGVGLSGPLTLLDYFVSLPSY